jgi:hypothetical protein
MIKHSKRNALAALISALIVCAVPSLAAAQEVTDPNMEVDSIALEPGEGVVFGFGQGFSHQLLLVRHRGEEALATPLAPGEVRAVLYTDAGETWLEMENGTGEILYFDALADRNGNGGFGSVPSTAVPVGERIIAGRWAFSIVSLVIGEFSYGPHGGHNH